MKRILILALLTPFSAAAAQAQPDLAGLTLEDLLNVPIEAAGVAGEKTLDSAALAQVVGEETIKSRGYSTLLDLLEAAGIDRVLALDLHAGQIQGFFKVPVDHLFAAPVMIDYLGKKELRDAVIVAPDAGGVERARAIAKRLNAGLAIIDKRREGPNAAVAMHLIGDVRARDAVVIDDMIDTAGTLIQAVGALAREGARRILACGVHPVLSGPALERIGASPLEEVVVTNSIPVPAEKRIARVTVLTVAPLLGEAIRRIHDEESVSTLFV